MITHATPLFSKKKGIDSRKMTIILAFFLFFSTSLYSEPISNAQGQSHQGQTLWDKANQIWRGNYSPEDLAKWENRLGKLRAREKWRKIAICYNVVGVIHFHVGNSDEALKKLNQSLQISRRIDFEKMVMMGLFWIANVQKRKGLLEEALRNLQESMAIAKTAGNTGRAGRCLRLIGLIMLSKGHYKESLDYLNRSLQIARERQDDELMMLCQNSIGSLYRSQGNIAKSRDYFSRSFELSKRIENKKWQAHNLNGLGDTCIRQKDHDCALKNYLNSLALFEALDDKIGISKIYNKIGNVYYKKKKVREALHYYESSRDIFVAREMKVFVAKISLNIGMAYGRMGRWGKALEEIDEAIYILEEVKIPDILRECYHVKGRILERKGDLIGAEKNYKESARILETLREDVAGAEEEVLSFLQKRSLVYKRLIKLLLKQGKVAEALEYLERSRLKRLRDQFDQLSPLLINKEEEKAKTKEKELREKIEEVMVQLTEEKSKPKEKQNIQEISRLERSLSAKRQEFIEYVNNLREKFPELASLLAIQPDTLIDLQTLLPPQVGIVQYLILEERLYIFLVTSKSVSYKEVKIIQTDLEEKIDHFRNLLMNPRILSGRGIMAVKPPTTKDKGLTPSHEILIDTFYKASEDLYHFLIKPVEEKLSQFKILGIIPNGKLHLLPYQALGEKKPGGGFRFLIEDKSLFQLNSQSILKFAQKQAKQIGEKSKLIAFGNPDKSLKYAEEEIERIKDIFSKSLIFFNENASENKIKSLLTGFDVLHLATHAKLNENIKESYILLAKSSDGKDDGKLYLREIWALPLRGYQLVTLSACETARGREASGDIMVSLETAFLRAGAPTIVASLWQVDDQATGILMKNFYHNLMSQGKAAALRAAQLTLMKNPRYSFPFYWAPFTLVGDWR